MTSQPVSMGARAVGERPFPDLPEGTDTLPQVDHILVLMMENHTYDNWLGMLGRGPGQQPRGDGFTIGRGGQPTASNPTSDGQAQHAFHMPTTCQLSGKPTQEWTQCHIQFDDGRNDGFVKSGSGPVAMGYWTGADLPWSYSLATTFSLGDRWFAPVLGQTYPNRRYLLAATSVGMVDDVLPETIVPPPHGTIYDLLDAHQISWRNYYSTFPATSYLYLGDAIRNHDSVVPVGQFFTDAKSDSLPGFAIIDPSWDANSGEDPQNIVHAEVFAASVVQAVMDSPAWPRTLLVWTFDEGGGYYDHVPPPPAVAPDDTGPDWPAPAYTGFAQYGFRVPAVVVSPWSRPGYVTNVVHDHTSVLAMVERKWNLPALTRRDAAAKDLSDFLDLNQAAFANPPALATPRAGPAQLACEQAGPGQIPPRDQSRQGRQRFSLQTMSKSRRIKASVVIVGGGPVGLALAATLGQAGIRCALVEGQLKPSAVPKGQNLTARSLEHFYFWNCADELHEARLLPSGFPIGGITAYENLASDYWYAPAGRETVAEFYYERNERLPQYLTESVLRNRVSQLGSVTGLFGWSAVNVAAGSDGVRMTAVQHQGGEHCEIEGDYLVGCDGARSRVRDQAGIGSGGADFDQRMVLAVFRSRELHRRLDRFPLRTTYRVLHPELKGYWWFFGRVDATETWFFHAPVGKDATAANFDAHALIERAAGVPVTCAFEHVGFWDLRIDIADAYRQGRVFIAGDAAHSHPPYGAHGLNTGLEDAVNLGWKLTAVLEGWGGPRLLDSYQQERRPVFAETGQVIAEGIAKDGAFLERYSPRRDRGEFERAWSGMTGGETAPPWYEPHYEGSPIVCGPAGAVGGVRGQHTFEARPGHHLAPAVLSSGRNVFEHLGGTFTLIALTGDPGPAAAFQAAARTLRMPLQVVADTFDDLRASYRQRFILVRPDQYVTWTGNDPPADATALLRQAVGG